MVLEEVCTIIAKFCIGFVFSVCCYYFIEHGCFQTFDGVPLDVPWFQASPASNRFFLATTGSGTLGMSTTAGLGAFGSFDELYRTNRMSCYHTPLRKMEYISAERF